MQYYNSIKKITTSLITVILMSSASVVFSNTTSKEIQSHQSIRDAAKAFASQLAKRQGNSASIDIEVGSLDSRLRLSKCSQALSTFESPNSKTSGKTTVGVRCDGDIFWKLYISVNIKVMKEIAVLKNPITRNSILTADDITLVKKDISSLHQGYYTQANKLVGKHVKRAMKSGTIITPAKVKNPLAIKKGSMVTILADISGIKVRMKGKALKSGSLGDWITAKNLSSNRKIEGKILKSGVILVTL